MKFGQSQINKFQTTAGAYSLVTEREYYDSQITATDTESEILINHFKKENIHIGPVRDNAKLAKKSFKLYPTGQNIFLNLLFPKPSKTELRLYLSVNAGFKPEAGNVWFMFEKNNELWLGEMREELWRLENSEYRVDESESVYQEVIHETDEIKIQTLKERDIFYRDRKLAIHRMELSNYKCEFEPKHNLFISRYSHAPYLEAHHLLPISLQKSHKQSLDVLDNIFSLCPFCHRAVHHAEKEFARQIIHTLIEHRPQVLNILNLQQEDVFKYYSVEEIY